MAPKKKLAQLPAARVAELRAIRDRWLDIGLRTGPGNRERAWEGIRAAYVTAGRPAPALWLWMRSPLEQVYACALLRARASTADGDQVSDQVRDPAEREALSRLAWWSGWWMPGGWGTSYWLAYLEALKEYCDFERVAPLIDVAESCASAWTFPDIVVFCQPPVWIRRDEQNRLHCEDGPAVLFGDGWGVWAWHGIRVSQRVIEQPQTISIEEALREQNAEIRRIMLLRIGAERLEREGKMVTLDEVTDDQVEIGHDRDGLPVPIGLLGGKLLEFPAVDGMPAMRWVSLLNSTPEPDGSIKRYMLRVPPTAKTVRGAVAWTFDVPVKEYAPVAES